MLYLFPLFSAQKTHILEISSVPPNLCQSPARAPAHILLSGFSQELPHHLHVMFKACFITSPPTASPRGILYFCN